MTTKTYFLRILLLSLLLLITMMGTGSLCAASPPDDQRQQASSVLNSVQQVEADLKGTWSGTFLSNHASAAPFNMTVVIDEDSQGHLVGSATHNSDCLNDVRLQVTVAGSRVLLAGSDEDGNNITVRGTVDKTGTLLRAKYILNGSATGRCETDDGTANLAKR